jgi:uncharacterized protein
MSQENVELVREGYAAFFRGDVNAVLAGGRLDPEIEVRAAEEFPGEVTYHGYAGFRTYMGRWMESWEQYKVTPEEFIDAGDRVVVVYRAVGRGHDSGVEVEMLRAHVWTIRDEKAVRWEIFAHPAEALEAAGLRE